MFCCFLLQHLPLTQGQGNGNGNMGIEVGEQGEREHVASLSTWAQGGVSLGYMPVITIHRGTHSAFGSVLG